MPLCLEAGQRLVNRAEGQVTSGAPLDFVVHRHAVGGVAHAEDAEEDELFELSEHVASISVWSLWLCLPSVSSRLI